ncbi:MAG: SRPBCC family protein [Novosphingobium sp.]
MIETEQTVLVRAGIGEAWAYARDIRRWAELVPGMQSCDIRDEDTSRWVVKVGVGGLVRTVTVDVEVTRWSGPEAVDFTYQLKGDPVTGGGTYRAAAVPEGTSLALGLRVAGSGPMAPMWEAMGRPLLPELAKGFAEQLRAGIEAAAGVITAEQAAQAKMTFWGIITAWLARLFGRGAKTA